MNREEIKWAAFADEMQKIAGSKSETAGALAYLLAGGASIPGYLLGRVMGSYGSQEALHQSNRHMLSNLLPLVGSIRLGRRHATESALKWAKKHPAKTEQMKKIAAEEKKKGGGMGHAIGAGVVGGLVGDIALSPVTAPINDAVMRGYRSALKSPKVRSALNSVRKALPFVK